MAIQLTKPRVRRIKKRIVAGDDLRKVATDFDTTYMTVYKIAIGATWQKVKPRGRLIARRNYASKRVFTLAQCQALALKKIQKKLSNAAIATKLGQSESTVKRAVDVGRIALGLRLHRLTIQGNLNAAQRRFGLSDEDVEDMITMGTNGHVPEWIRREIEGDDDK